MSLEDDLKQALLETGNRIKEDLWTDQDPIILAQRARDLAGLNVKMLTATDPEKRRQYQLAAELAVQHVALLALMRISYAEKRVLQEIEKFFMETLAKLIPALIAAI